MGTAPSALTPRARAIAQCVPKCACFGTRPPPPQRLRQVPLHTTRPSPSCAAPSLLDCSCRLTSSSYLAHRASSSWCVPMSQMALPSTTTMRSALTTVLKRCAITTTCGGGGGGGGGTGEGAGRRPAGVPRLQRQGQSARRAVRRCTRRRAVRRCTRRTVRLSIARSIASCTKCSLSAWGLRGGGSAVATPPPPHQLTSSALVASSNRRTLGLTISARAIAIRCFCPPL